MEEVGGSNPPYSTIIAQLTALGYKPKAVLYGIWYGALHHTRIITHHAQLQATIQHTATSLLNHHHSPKTAATALPGSGVLR